MNRTFTHVRPATALKSVFLFITFTILMGNLGWADVVITKPTNGTSICSFTAVSGGAPAYTTLSNIAITEGLVGDFPRNKNGTITISAPAGWQFNAGVGTVSKNVADLSSIAIGITSSTITLTWVTPNVAMTLIDIITISGIQVQATSTGSAAGSITCTAISQAVAGIVVGTSFADLALVSAPSITANPTNSSIAPGANTSFSVTASNTPTSYTWEVSTDGGTIWSTVINGGVYSTATAATLNITSAPIGMNGYKYRASATNACGTSAFSTAATLTVLDIYLISSGGTSTTCSGSFYDSGGSIGNYLNNENHTKTFAPSTPGAKVKVHFNSFNTESGFDYLYVYDGPTTASPQVAGSPFNGTSIPGDITSTYSTGELTFRFTSDVSNTPAGWDATISCYSTCNAPTSVTASVTPTESCTAPQTVTFDVASFSGGNVNGGQWEYEWREGATVKRAWSTTSSYAPSLSASVTYTVYMRSSACVTSVSTGASATYTYNSSAPTCAGTPSPANAATNVAVGSVLSWSAVAGATSYDVYFGTSTTPGFVANVTTNSYTPTLASATTYYWYVIPKNACGSASGCGTSNWSFATASCTSDIYVTATVGTLTGSYTTLKGAFDKINDGTHKGVISISVGRNTTETATAALNASGSGSASYTSVLIQPCGGSYTITSTPPILSGVPIVNLNGADNVTINGINSGGNLLTFCNTNATSGSSAIQFINDATNNIVRNCKIYSSNTSTSSGTIVFSTTTGTTGNDNNTIEYCSIYDGTTAPYVGIYSSGTTTSTAHYNSNNTISNCNIYNFINPAGSDGWDTPGAGVFNTGSDFGIKLSAGTTAWTISGNSFYQNKSATPYSNGTTATHYAINITNTSGTGFVVENNYIGGRAANCAGTAWTINQSTIKSNFTAIHLDVGVGGLSTINHNVIDNISVSTSAQGTSQDAPFMGILVRGYLDVSYNTLGGTSGIVFSSVSSAADFDGIYQFDESANAIGTYTTNNNSISNITISNTSGANANVYLLRAYSKNYQTTWTCNNNTIGGTAANSINCQNYHWVHGIFFSWGTSISASGNTIQNITCAYSGIHGIKEQSDAVGATTSSTYSGNTIKTIKCLSGQVNGILLDGGNSTNNLIERNLIYDLNGVTVTAINHSNSRSPFTDVIRNNMIAIGNSIATSTTRGIRYESSSGTCNIYHNSVYLHGSSTTTYCMEKATAATACNVKNNIFYNNCSSGAKYALYYSETTGLTSDCNDLYVPSAQTGFVPSTGYTTLANWQTNTIYDDNSVSIDPGFLSMTAPYNLHVDSGIRVLVCTGLVTNDFDSEGRVVPHIGADEAPITLPVSLVRFDASCNESGVMIFWSTASETNNNFFTLERSDDLNGWTLVAKVQGAGNSNTLLNYSFADQNLLRGLTYYRLTQTDFNGASETFEPVAVRCDESLAEVTCYPNPFTDQLVVTLQNIGAEQGSLVLRDVTGRVVMQRELNANDFGQQSATLTLSGIASGVYSLEFRAGSYEKIMRVVKNK